MKCFCNFVYSNGGAFWLKFERNSLTAAEKSARQQPLALLGFTKLGGKFFFI